MGTDDRRLILEIDFAQKVKHARNVCGDTFHSVRLRDERRTISILSDGLGSGVKASVLSILTAVMASRFTAGFRDPKRTAEIIMRTLPVCKERKISYATFTILDVDNDGLTRIMEYDNPPFLLIREGQPVEVVKAVQEGIMGRKRKYTLKYSQFQMMCGDRLICFSDGVTQSGIGSKANPLGWGAGNSQDFILETIRGNPEISARNLSRRILAQAVRNDGGMASDDITCGVAYFRNPRELLIATGPPYDCGKDSELSGKVARHVGPKIICGGTTAKIISRELGRKIIFDLAKLGHAAPPPSIMEGVDFVTEGIITLGQTSEILKSGAEQADSKNCPARRIADMMMDSDIVRFIVGTRINEAYQAPDIPDEIALRKSIVREIARMLEEKYLKETVITYI
ncbi:MAG: SpoIIE family protein phosphatase [Victivallales bacterium]|jgi:hypothetical protein